MLKIRPNCEHCNKALPNTSREAMNCFFVFTYCKQCAVIVFENVCPNCNGNFVELPIRPHKLLEKHPASTQQIFIPKNLEEVKKNQNSIKIIPSAKR